MSRTLWIDGHLLDASTLDPADVDTIMSLKGLVPLSTEERNYIHDMADSLAESTAILEVLIASLTNKEARDVILNMVESIEDVVENNIEMLSVDIDRIGRGLGLE